MSNLIEVAVPDIGDFDAVEVIEVLVAVGDTVEVEQALLTLESDKASMEIPSSAAGIVEQLLVDVGDSVSEGTVVIKLKPAGEAAAEPEQTAPAVEMAVPATSETVQVVVPDIGDFDTVEVIEINVAVGDAVEEEQTLITLESDKASMEIPSSAAGVVQAITVAVGDQVGEGTVIAELSGKVGATAPVQAEASAPAVAEAAPAPISAKQAPASPVEQAPAPITSRPDKKIHASPAVRKFARELGVDLSLVTQATGPKGRLLKVDIQQFVKVALSGGTTAASGAVSGGAGIPPIPAVDFSKFGEIEEKPLSKIKKLTGVNLSRAWLNLPMVTHHEIADITDMEAFRKSLKAVPK
jgi:pyruvate dehydrogenase E2 component (dihydrolipoamide acetyltransferase)